MQGEKVIEKLGFPSPLFRRWRWRDGEKTYLFSRGCNKGGKLRFSDPAEGKKKEEEEEEGEKRFVMAFIGKGRKRDAEEEKEEENE